jgi:hypothetical protein
LDAKSPFSDYFSREELAQALGRSAKTLDRWDLNGLGPPRVQIGKLVLYRKAAVERWLLDREGKRLELAGVNK